MLEKDDMPMLPGMISEKCNVAESHGHSRKCLKRPKQKILEEILSSFHIAVNILVIFTVKRMKRPTS